jgi:hypothetical protein
MYGEPPTKVEPIYPKRPRKAAGAKKAVKKPLKKAARRGE